MKQISIILIILFSLMNCTNSNNSTNYYNKPINDWMNSNLNDISSYEPVEFKIIKNSNDIIKISYQIHYYVNVLQRELELLPKLISELKTESNIDTLILKKIIEIKSQLSEIDLVSEPDFNKIDDLNTKLDNSLNKLSAATNISNNQNMLILSAQLEGTLSRCRLERKKLETDFVSIGSSINNFHNDIKSGCFIYHKYRAKNAFNAYILQETIFKLDNKKKTVVKAINIK